MQSQTVKSGAFNVPKGRRKAAFVRVVCEDSVQLGAHAAQNLIGKLRIVGRPRQCHRTHRGRQHGDGLRTRVAALRPFQRFGHALNHLFELRGEGIAHGLGLGGLGSQRHQRAAIGRIVAVRAAHIAVDKALLEVVIGAALAKQAALGQGKGPFQGLCGQRFLGRKMRVERTMREACRLHDLGHPHALKPTHTKEPRGFIQNAFAFLCSFAGGVSHDGLVVGVGSAEV